MTPNQIAIATTCTLQGQPHHQIAEQIGVHRTTVTRNLNKPDIRAYIEKEAQEIIQRGLKPARRTLTRLAALGNTKDIDKDLIALSLKASQHITNIAGLSGNTPGTVINNLIYQQGAHTEQSPEALAMLQRALGLPQNDVIDVHIEDKQA